MSIWEAILWGALQGATEFLPVSSSGHLVLVPWLLQRATPSVTFDVILHAGTLLATFLFFWRDIWALLHGLVISVRDRHLTAAGRLALLIAASAVPAGVLGFIAKDLFTHVFGRPAVVAVLLLVTGGLLWLGESLGRRVRGIETLSLRDALLIGLAQCVALLPGISRSGVTISTGLLRGLEREAATRFSFLMVLPLIAGATGYELLGFSMSAGIESWALMLAGFVAAAVVGYAALHLLLRWVRRNSLRPFAFYCWAVGLGCLLLLAVR